MGLSIEESPDWGEEDEEDPENEFEDEEGLDDI